MAEVRFTIEDSYLDGIRKALANPEARNTDLVKDALTILRWAAEERSSGRYIMSMNKDGSDAARLAMPSLEAAASIHGKL